MVEVINGWLIYHENNDWVIDDECGNKYYYPSYEEAARAAMNMN